MKSDPAKTSDAEDLLSERERTQHRIQRLSDILKRRRSGREKQQDSLNLPAQTNVHCPLQKLVNCSQTGNASMCVEVYDSYHMDRKCPGAILVA